MRRASVVLVMLFICAILGACSGEYRVDVEGIENFNTTEGYVEINVHLLPDENFLDKYTYASAKYNHKEIFKSRLSIVATECSIIVVNYNDEYYSQAKEDCLRNIDLVNEFEYNGYVFAENIMLAIGQDRLTEENKIECPEWFNMFAYHDEKRCLVFIGANILEGIEENTKTDPVAWGEFLQEYFAEFHDFS